MANLLDAVKDRDLSRVRTLLAEGADVNQKDRIRQTALHWSATRNNPDVARLLLQAGADHTAETLIGWTALHYSARYDKPDVALVLLQAGADHTAVDKDGKTAMDWAKKYYAQAVIDVMREYIESGEAGTQKTGTKMKNKAAIKYKHGTDATDMKWTDDQVKRLIETSVMRILTAGRVEAGKTSLVQSLLTGNQYLTKKRDRTVVVECHNWKLPNGKVVPIYDLGGHRSYYYTGHFYHYNAVNNIILLCQELMSDDFHFTYMWLQAILTRSPLSNIIPILTKADKAENPEKVIERKEYFLKILNKKFEYEIKQLSAILDAPGQPQRKVTENYQQLKERYEAIQNIFNESILVVSCALEDREGIEKLEAHITTLSEKEEYNVMIPKEYTEFYSQLGKLGIQDDTNQAGEYKMSMYPGSDKKPPLPPKQRNLMTSASTSTKKLGIQDDTNQAGEYKMSMYPGSDKKPPLPPKQRNLMTSASTSTKKLGIQDDTNQAGEYKMSMYPGSDKKPPLPPKQINLMASASTSTEKTNPVKETTKVNQQSTVSFKQAEKLYKSIAEKHKANPHGMRDCLRYLHSLGLLLWFEGSQVIESVIFNDIAYFRDILKKVFHHDLLQGLKYESLGEKSKALFKHKGEFQKNVEKITKEGIITKPILKLLLESSFDNIEVVSEILELLNVAYKIPGDECNLFMPFYVEESLPEEIQKKIKLFPISGKTEQAISVAVIGNISTTLWHHLSLLVTKHIEDNSRTQQRLSFSNGLWARLDKMHLYISFENGKEILIMVRSKVDQPERISKMWMLIQDIRKFLNDLISDFWPGLLLRFVLYCCHCYIKYQSSVDKVEPIKELDLDDILDNKKDSESFNCDEKEDEDLPSALIRPLSTSGTVAQQQFEDLKSYLDANAPYHELIGTGTNKQSLIPQFSDVSDKTLMRLAKHIGEDKWMELGVELDFTTIELQHIQNDNPNVLKNAVHAMLVKWRQKRGSGDKENAEMLANILSSCGLPIYRHLELPHGVHHQEAHIHGPNPAPPVGPRTIRAPNESESAESEGQNLSATSEASSLETTPSEAAVGGKSLVKIVESNFKYLVDNLCAEEHLDYLLQEGALSREDYQVIRCEPGDIRQTRMMLQILLEKNNDDLIKVLQVSMDKPNTKPLLEIFK